MELFIKIIEKYRQLDVLNEAFIYKYKFYII